MNAPAAKAPLPRSRRILYTGLLLAGTWVSAELAAFGVLSVAHSRVELPSRLRAERQVAAAQALARTYERPRPVSLVDSSIQHSVLHPYLGYVEDPTVPNWLTFSEQGFTVVRGQGRPQPADRFTVAIFGGSVAQHLCLFGNSVLRAELERLPQAQGKPVWIACYALGGYKQPQQALALAYALARGERFDLVLNLDGFNDVALAVAENLPNGVNPYYPRSWQVTAAGAFDLDVLRRAGEVSFLEGRRAGAVAFLERSALRNSALAHVAWLAFDRHSRDRIERLERLDLVPRARRSYQRTGPAYPSRSRPEVFRDLAAFWARSSRLMSAVCRSWDVPYFHFLQPNQYVEGSKPMGEAERSVAIRKNSRYGRGAKQGYPDLIAAGRELRIEGERFFDLTAVFARVPEPLYVDDCCHLSTAGTERLAREIASRIVDSLRSEPALTGNRMGTVGT
jgi:hypothetical protein